MKHLFLLALLAAAPLVHAGEAAGVFAYQVTDRLSEDGPEILRVYCRDHYGMSTIPSFGLITAPNIPPTNSPDPIGDHNLLSASGITITNSTEEPWIITIDARRATLPSHTETTLPQLLQLASRAVALTAREWKIKNYRLRLLRPPTSAP